MINRRQRVIGAVFQRGVKMGCVVGVISVQFKEAPKMIAFKDKRNMGIMEFQSVSLV